MGNKNSSASSSHSAGDAAGAAAAAAAGVAALVHASNSNSDSDSDSDSGSSSGSGAGGEALAVAAVVAGGAALAHGSDSGSDSDSGSSSSSDSDGSGGAGGLAAGAAALAAGAAGAAGVAAIAHGAGQNQDDHDKVDVNVDVDVDVNVEGNININVGGNGQEDVCDEEESFTVSFDFEDCFEAVVGMGGSIAFYKNWLTCHENNQKIYAEIFGGLRPTILRYRNTYSIKGCNAEQVTEEMRTDGELHWEAKQKLGYEPETLLTSWSPPGDFKNTGNTCGGDGATLKFTDGVGFDYGALAKWWVDSINAYRNIGIPCRWISVQNEPDYDTPHHDSCMFDLEEDEATGKPGYHQLVSATYDLVNSCVHNPPGLIGPEHTEIDGYLPTGDLLEKLEAVGNHMYGSGYEKGKKCDGFEFPESLIPSIKKAGCWAVENCKPLFMTEFGKLKDHEHGDPLKLGEVVLETFLNGGVSAYLHWDLFWGAGTGEGSLVLIENPWKKHEWKTECGYYLTQSYYWYKHFCRYIRPGMKRVFSKSHSKAILAVAFYNDSSAALTVVIINKSTSSVPELPLNGLPLGDRQICVFRSTLDEKMAQLGVLTESVLRDIPPQSIFTLSTEVSDT